MSTPSYRVTLSFDNERKVFIARAPELAHCHGEGATRAQAIAQLEEEIEAQVQNMRAHGSHPPVAVDEEAVSGELALKVSQTLHRQLLWQARAEGVELDHLAGEILAGALEARRAGPRAARAGGNRPVEAVSDNVGNGPSAPGQSGNANRGRGFNPRYTNNTNLLDDRANFIEYVRNLEHSGGTAAARPADASRGPGGGAGRRRRRGGPGGAAPNGGGGNGGNGGGRF